VAQQQPQAGHHLVAVGVQRQRVGLVHLVNLVLVALELHPLFPVLQ
jgi:hypothetical protein